MATPPRILPPDVVNALRRGNKIEAIKLLRQATGLGLAEAKDVVDAYALLAAGRGTAGDASQTAAHGASGVTPHSPVRATSSLDPHLSPGEVPRIPNFGWIVAIVVIAAVAGFLYLAF
jgi:hypothetical protein